MCACLRPAQVGRVSKILMKFFTNKLLLPLLLAMNVALSNAATCPINIAGSPQTSVANDGLAFLRFALGLQGQALTNGIAVAPNVNLQTSLNAKTRFLDVDGDAVFTTNDALLIGRYLAGFADDALVSGITFSQTATRSTATAITDYFRNGCGFGVAGYTSDVFIAPSGPLCAARDQLTNACVEPTSSATTFSALSERITTGTDRVKFSTAGALCETNQVANFNADRLDTGHWPNRFTSSNRTCDLKRETLLLGAGAIAFRDTEFPYVRNETGRPRSRIYQSSNSTDKLFISTPDPLDPDAFDVLGIDAQYDYFYRQTGSTTQFVSDYSLKRWTASPGLLTDTQDAPTRLDLTYVGSVYFAVGDESPIGDGEYLNFTGGGCPIALKFDKVLGEISGDAIDCQGGIGNQPVSLSFKRLYIKQSRIFGALGSEMIASVTGSATPSLQPNGAPSVPINVQFLSTKIDGAIYGVNGSYIEIIGTAPNGTFLIRGFRSNVLGE
jgi:hypothetical protein